MRSPFASDLGAGWQWFSVQALGADAQVHILPGLGHATLWATRSGDPSPVMIENAIQVVEDRIESVARHVPAGTRLVASAATLAPLQREGAIAGLQEGAIAREQIEREYQWLAARSMRVPSARDRVFDTPSGDAVVLVLRERLHHLDLDAVHLQD